MRLRLVDRGAQYRHSAVDLDWLSSGKRTENCIDGNPDNIHIRFNTEGHRVESRGTKGMVRLRSDLTGSFRQKECFDFRRFYAPISLNESNDFALSVGIMLDIFGSGAEVGMTGQHLDIAQRSTSFADLPSRTGDESSAT
jgi:hypothetical protein